MAKRSDSRYPMADGQTRTAIGYEMIFCKRFTFKEKQAFNYPDMGSNRNQADGRYPMAESQQPKAAPRKRFFS